MNIKILAFEDKFYNHGTRDEICACAGVDSQSIAKAIMLEEK